MQFRRLLTILIVLALCTPCAFAEDKKITIPNPEPCSEKAEPSMPLLISLSSIGGLFGLFLVNGPIHEGEHVVVAASMGAEITMYKPYPHYDVDGSFTYATMHFDDHGSFSNFQKGLVYTAPKIGDFLIMGSYAFLLESKNLPQNKFGQIAIISLTSGAWWDFTHDLFTKNPSTDLNASFKLMGINSESARLPFRIGLAGISAVGLVELIRGYKEIFEAAPPPTNANRKIAVESLKPQSGPVLTPNFIGWGGTF